MLKIEITYRYNMLNNIAFEAIVHRGMKKVQKKYLHSSKLSSNFALAFENESNENIERVK